MKNEKAHKETHHPATQKGLASAMASVEKKSEAMNSDRFEFGLATGLLGGLLMAVGAVVVLLIAFGIWNFY